MLMRFKVKNYRSIKDEAVLDLEAVGLKDHRECLIKYKNNNFLPVISINGKNGGGKSNVIRAMWVAIQFIRNAQMMQIENAEIPVTPFALDDVSRNTPTSFEFEYECDGIWYQYGFSATRKAITEEHLNWAPKGQLSKVFSRSGQEFAYPTNNEKKMKEMIQKAVAPNQLFFAVSCTMNYQPCISAMKWFRTKIFFSRDYSDIGRSILDYGEDKKMLQSIVNIAKIADVGISDMEFEFNSHEIASFDDLGLKLAPEQIPQLKKALEQFRKNLNIDADGNGGMLKVSELKATSMHRGIDDNGAEKDYPLSLMDESDGTIKLMARSMAIEQALREGGIFIVDEIENRLHPILVEYILDRFQNQKQSTGAQLIFTTHSTDILNRELLRRDQYYFVDKSNRTGATELYSLAEFSPRNDERIGKAYLVGKYGAIPYVMEG